MKRLFAFASIVAAGFGLLNAAETLAETLRADGSTNRWTAADLQDALGLMNRMYWRDMKSDAGRRRWHGSRIGQYVMDGTTTNAFGRPDIIRVDIYSDGFVATNRSVRRRRGEYDPEARAKERAEAARRRDAARRVWEEANLPPALAAIREAQRQTGRTQEVTVVITP